MHKKRVAVLIIQDNKDRVLLMLRDNKPSIAYPDCWAFIGGHIDPGETPRQAAVREGLEELKFKFVNIRFLRKFVFDEIEYHVFSTKKDYELNQFDLQEGQKITFFSLSTIKRLEMSYYDKEILINYLTTTQSSS